MRIKLGKCLMALGIALMIASAGLFLYNHREDAAAEESASQVLTQLIRQLPQKAVEEDWTDQLIPMEFLPESAFEMTEVVVDGYGYIGCLSLPSLELELPILSQWDYGRLQIAPCRYSGSLKKGNLVLMAHNYASHFGRISDLALGDMVIFTDMDGTATRYQVVGRDVLAPTAVEEMTAGDFDLTLFTCTYGGQSRVTVYCDRLMQ